MDLLSLLSNSAASLSAHRAASATASHNLQNSATEGYARQRAELSQTLAADRVTGAWIGRGVELMGVSQARDRFVEAQLPGARAQSGWSSAAVSVLTSVRVLDPSSGSGVGAAMSGFFASLRALSQNPGEPGLRVATVGAGQSMALAFNRAASALEATRAGVDARIEGALPEVNALSMQVASLNADIRGARAGGAEPNDLLDARQRAVDRLAQLTGAQPLTDARGTVSLLLPGGGTLVAGTAASTLVVRSDPAAGGTLALHLASPGGAPEGSPVAPGGELGGLLHARDGALLDAARALDTLAYELASALNASHQGHMGLDGSTGRPLFSLPVTVGGAAARLTLDPAVRADPRALASSGAGLSGDPTGVEALLALESQVLPSGAGPAQTLAKLTATFGAATAHLEGVAEGDAALASHLVAQRESVSGVSIDDEMVNLTKAQRGYEAVLKVIQTADQMLETLLAIR